MSAAPAVRIELADFRHETHKQALRELMDCYARDPMGGGAPLDLAVLKHLPARLASIAGAYSVIAFDEDNPVGLINCFEGFSTFLARPLINIHDVVVKEAYRGQGICCKMLEKVEDVAVKRGSCKLTLEVLSQNLAAIAAYERFGFDAYQLAPESGTALFWQKHL